MTRNRLAARAQALATSIGAAAPLWESVNALANRPGMINMGQGFPDFAGSRVAREAASDAVKLGDAISNQYSPQPGLLELRQEVSNFVARRYNAPKLDANSEVVVTAGAQEGLAAAFLAFCNPGDEVVCFEPFYPFMLGAIAQAGAVPRVITLKSGDGFAIDEDALRAAAASPRAKSKRSSGLEPHVLAATSLNDQLSTLSLSRENSARSQLPAQPDGTRGNARRAGARRRRLPAA